MSERILVASWADGDTIYEIHKMTRKSAPEDGEDPTYECLATESGEPAKNENEGHWQPLFESSVRYMERRGYRVRRRN